MLRDAICAIKVALLYSDVVIRKSVKLSSSLSALENSRVPGASQY